MSKLTADDYKEAYALAKQKMKQISFKQYEKKKKRKHEFEKYEGKWLFISFYLLTQ